MSVMESATFDLVRAAITAGRVHVSDHAYDESAADGLSARTVIDGTPHGVAIEDYPNDARGPSCLVLLHIESALAVHAVWAFDSSAGRAILVTVYRPDPARWSDDLTERRPRT